jgi:hypothetical protein
MDWDLFWNAATSIATFLAVVIALIMPWWQTKVMYRKSVKINFYKGQMIPDGISGVCISVINTGNKEVAINSLNIKCNKGLFGYIKLSKLQYPIILKPEMEKHDFLPYEPFANSILQAINKGNLGLNDKLVVIATDVTGKQYKLKTKYRGKSFKINEGS